MGLFTFKEKTTPIPPSRFLQFFYLIKEHFLLFFTSSICQFIFFLPATYILISTYIRYSNEMNVENPNPIILYQTLISGGLLLLPTLLIGYLGEIGMYSIIKKTAFNEPVEFKDFWCGIKNNYLSNLFILITTSVLTALVVINYGTYLYGDINPIIKLIAFIVSIILFLLASLCKPYYILQKLIFNNTSIQICKNCLTFAFSKLFKSLGVFILSNIMLILLLFSVDWLRVLIIVLLIIIGGAYSSLLQYLHSLSVLETFIDKKSYPEIYHNGLNDFYEVKE